MSVSLAPRSAWANKQSRSSFATESLIQSYLLSARQAKKADLKLKTSNLIAPSVYILERLLQILGATITEQKCHRKDLGYAFFSWPAYSPHIAGCCRGQSSRDK